MKTKKTRKKNNYVLDTSAILCFWLNEEGADSVERILRKDENQIFISFMSFMEGKYRLWKEEGKAKAEEFYRYLDLLPVSRVDIDNIILSKAAEIKATNALSVADSFIIATAIASDAILVHKDPEFEQVKGKVTLLTLPYKSKKIKGAKLE